MRPGQNKRMRGRPTNNRRGPNPLTRSYESNGPDVKIRGNAHHVAEKYLQLARDAHTGGDPVAAENYLQHAEHYFRLIAAAHAAQALAQSGQQRPPGEDEDGMDDDGDFDALSDRFRPKLSRICCERDGSHLRVARLGRSRHARRADVTDRIDLDPLRISLYQRRPWPRSDHCPTFGRPFCRPPRLTLFRCFSDPSRGQIVRVGSGWKAEAAKFALPANPSRTE